jgi:AmmeMemoRadiSam system protein B
MLVRRPAVANFFYPGNAAELEQSVKMFLQNGKDIEVKGKLTGIIAPHAGYIYSGIVAGSCYKQFTKLDTEKKWKIILLGPSHRYPLRGASVCAYDSCATPLGEIKVSDVAREMAEKIGFIPEADEQEHSLEVQFPFLQMIFKNFEIIPLVLGQVDVRKLADFVKGYIDDDTLFVISTDLSHYFPYEKAVSVDSIANKAIPALDVDTMAREGDACGITGVLTSMLIARDLGWKNTFLDYKNSGDTAGPKDRVVGYGAYAYSV